VIPRRRAVVVAAVVVAALVLAGGGYLVLRPDRAAPRQVAVSDPTVEAPAAPESAAPAPSSASPVPRVSSTPPQAPRTTPPGAAANLATGLRRLPAATRQVVIVHADGYGTSHATLEAFTRTGSGWQPAFGAMAARIGVNGFSDSKVEGDLETPTGMYPFGSTMYGIAANPGVRYAYHRLVPDDWWNENPATPGYNSFAHGPSPGGASEALWQITPQYDHFAVINYNIPVVAADPPRGSGIFLHVINPGRATAGCVALERADLLRILKWLDPAASPRIVMAPRSALSRF